MRKSFTRLSSLLVLLLLSIQMVLATPTLITTGSGGLNPVDGGVISPVNPVFTMTFQANVQPGELQIIGLYNSSGAEAKAIQLRASDKTTNGSVITYTHPDGVVTFNGNVVTIRFTGVNWQQKALYWITVGASAIKDATGNFNATTGFGGDARWQFTIQDLVAPAAQKLFPPDAPPVVLVPTNYNPGGPGNLAFAIKFTEDVKFIPGYVQGFEDFAIYTSTDNRNTSYQEGGDLITLQPANLYCYKSGSLVANTATFDSLVIDWTRPSLPGYTDLYVRVKSGIIVDLATPTANAFAGMNNETLWNFTTKDDVFDAPVVTKQGTATPCDGLKSNNKFIINFADGEVLHYASSGLLVAPNAELKNLTIGGLKAITIVDKNGLTIDIASAVINTTNNEILVTPATTLLESGISFEVKIKAEVFKDGSGNLSKEGKATFNAGNWNAPKVVTKRVTNQDGTSFDFLISTNEPCAVHYIVVRKDHALAPDVNDIFGHSALNATVPNAAIIPGSANNDRFHRIFYPGTDADPDILPALAPEGNPLSSIYGWYYGQQISSTPTFKMVEIFAEGNIIIPTANFEVLKRINRLPATHGVNDTPSARYEIWFELIDTICTQDTYASNYWITNKEHISSDSIGSAAVFTTDILMPEAWFDGDSSKVTPLWGKLNPTTTDKYGVKSGAIPANVDGNGVYGELDDLAKDGKIYINFNEPISKANNDQFSSNAATQNTELKACLWVYEDAAGTFNPALGTATTPNRNSDIGWSTNYGYHASLSPDRKQITITPDSSWSSEATVWVKIRNSKIQDPTGNEIVPYGNFYTQEYGVESYIAPLVRYTFGSIYEPLDSMLDVPYKINHNTTVASLTVTVSSKIYVYPGCLLEDGIVPFGTLVPFTNDTTKLSYIGKFFKIRKGDANSVSTSSFNSEVNALESQFNFTIDYEYGDSTKITITPKVQYDSEVWYIIQLDGRVQDENLRTITQGADVNDDDDRPLVFKLDDALTGNPTEPTWISGDPTTDDNKTCAFKSEDSRNPHLTFYTKKQSTLLSNLVNINTRQNISISDTIGVYIDEYVSLGFDHYVHFDALTGSYTLDANAMRRYFRVYDDSLTLHEVNFDVVGLDIHAIQHDSMIFYIDPYYVNDDGTAKPTTETENFTKCKKYWVHFNSEDADDHGLNAEFGKEKGTYWDPNHNKVVMDNWAWFKSNCDPTPGCVAAVITPTPEAINLNPGAISNITIAFNYAVRDSVCIQIQENASAPYTVAGRLVDGNSNIVRYPVVFHGDSSYTITLGASVCGDILINSGIGTANQWPSEACNANVDSIWHYKMVDATPPALDTLPYIVHSKLVDAAKYPTYLIPRDDSVGFDKTQNLVLVFTEEVQTVSGKRLVIYDSSDNQKDVIYAQNCTYGTHADKTIDKHVIIVPHDESKLYFNTNYHITIDNGFVTDFSPLANKWAGIWVADQIANGGPEDLLNDWSFRTGPDPAPYFTLFSPQNGTPTVAPLTVTFSEEVYAHDISGTDEIQIFEITAGNVKTLVKTLDVNEVAEVAKISAKVFQLVGFTPVYAHQYCVRIPAAAFIDGNGSALQWPCDTTGVLFSNTAPVAAQTQEENPATWYVSYRDDVRPFAHKNWPLNGAKHVPYNAYSYIEFTEPVLLSDGSAIITDPNLIEQTIHNFVHLLDADNGNADVAFHVEFVGNHKRLLRITPLDVNGYNYNPITGQPAMRPCRNYTIQLLPTWTTYSIVDLEGNEMPGPGITYSFLTEDITAPVISNPTVAVDACTNKFNFTYDVTEDCSDTVRLYYAIMPITSTHVPTAAEIFAKSVPDAYKCDVVGGKSGLGSVPGDGVKFTVDMGNWDENPKFKLYAVAKDLEVDIWQPASSAWDSLFFFNPYYAQGYDRILDIMPAGPDHLGNRSTTPVATNTFMIWDDNAPHYKGSYPVSEQLQFPVNDSLAFWFSEKVEQGNVAGMPDTIYLRRYDNNIAVKATVKWKATGIHADSIFVIDPLVPLAQETKYYVEFDRYAIEDTQDVCVAAPNVYYPQMVGRGFWFKTQDNLGPRWASNSPANGATCVSCPNLNANGTDVITVDFYDANEVIVAANAPDPFVYLYRAEDNVVPAVAWNVIPKGEITVVNDTITDPINGVDTLWHVIIPLHHQYYPNDSIRVEFPHHLITDKFGNAFTYGGVNNVKVVWNYVTCNTEAPAVTWSIHSLVPYFNYSAMGYEDGIYGDWAVNYMSGQKGDIKSGVPTHIALKIDFGEEVAFNTSGTTWETLDTYVPTGTAGLTQAELFSIIHVGDLVYNTTVKQDTILNVSGNTVTIGFLATTSTGLPINTLLADAQSNGNIGPITAPIYLQDFYDASLVSLKTYAVTVSQNKIRATNNCVKGSGPRYVEPNIVTLNTRDDTPPTVDFVNNADASLCESNACIEKDEEITIKFSGPVVKSSFDVEWLGEESYTFDNLPLNASDLNTVVGHYLEFYQVTSSVPHTRVGSRIPVTVVSLDAAKTRYKIKPTSKLTSETWYELVFKPFTVKKFIENDANGTIYEGGDTCRFLVGDHEVPVVQINADADGFVDGLKPSKANIHVSSDISNLYVVFDEAVKVGSGIARIRSENGAIINEYTTSMVTLQNKISSNGDTLVIPIVHALAQFTKYYVEMDPGFITDDNTICDVNPFAGFAAKLGSDGEMLSADWWFKTTDATPPELLSIVNQPCQRDPLALFPAVGDTVAKNSDLVLIFDENIHIHNIAGPFVANNGITIYHDNGDQNSFGNAVEYISWQNIHDQIEITGTDQYNGLTTNKIVIDPETVFDSKGTYYVRVRAENIFDDGENSWSASTCSQLDGVKDHEWWFTIVNDVAPVLVATTPTYDGVNDNRNYVKLPADPHGFVKADLSMTFYDNTIANGGVPLKVARGSANKFIRIYEYTYDAPTAQWKAKPWDSISIQDPRVELDYNVVTIKNEILRDGIMGKGLNGLGASLLKDSVYYVTVDPGAILNGFPESSTWWQGIANGFRWRFQTLSDDVFVAEPNIISPNLVDDGAGAQNLTIAAASTLIVEFGEGIETITGAPGRVQVFKVGETTPAIPAIPVAKTMISGKTLTVPLTGIIDETNYFVQIQANAFGDTSTISTPNTEFGGVGVWEFQTGDNTPPDAITKTPAAGCVGSSATLTMTFDETHGVTKGAGTLTVTDPEGTVVAQVAAADITISEDGNTVTAAVTGLPDTTLLTVTVPAGFLFDGDPFSALPNPVITWTFTTGENTVPTVEEITPAEAVTPVIDLAIKFSEKVLPVADKSVTINGEAVAATDFETADSITYTLSVDSLISESTYSVVIEAGAFADLAVCLPNEIAETTLSFTVADIIAPIATGSPTEAPDYIGLVLSINFTEPVTVEAGDVVIYDADTDLPIETIAASAFTATAGNTIYTYAPQNVRFGDYYILIDAGAFVDTLAAPIAKACPGISSKTGWPLSIIDNVFVDCHNIIYPLRGTLNVPLDTVIVIDFCGERIAPGTGLVTIGDQSIERVLNVNYFEYPVTADMISGNKLSVTVTGLSENTTYSIIIPDGAITDEAGNPFGGITDANLWIFTTGDFTDPVVSVPVTTVLNDGTGAPIAITSSEAGLVYLAEEGVPATAAGLLAAIAQNKAVVATLAAPGSVSVSAEGLEPGIYKAYGFDASGRKGTAVNVVTVQAPPVVPYFTIKQIQGEVAASPKVGQKVRTNGTVTAVTTTGFFMQDANAAWSGIFVSTSTAVGKGASVEVIGTVAEVDGLTTIGTIEAINPIAMVINPTAVTVGPAVAIAEMHEGVFVKVTGRAAAAGTFTADWNIASLASTNYIINNAIYGSYTALKDYKYVVTGIGTAANKVLAIDIKNQSQIDSKIDLENAVKVYPNPFDKYITLSVSNDVVITKAVITNIAGQLVKEVINPNNTIPTSELRSGVYFISLHTVDGIAKTERIIKR